MGRGGRLHLRKVIHPQAHDDYRVVLKLDGDEFEIGSIGIQDGAAWAWGIDTVIPVRSFETEGEGRYRNDCIRLQCQRRFTTILFRKP